MDLNQNVPAMTIMKASEVMNIYSNTSNIIVHKNNWSIAQCEICHFSNDTDIFICSQCNDHFNELAKTKIYFS